MSEPEGLGRPNATQINELLALISTLLVELPDHKRKLDRAYNTTKIALGVAVVALIGVVIAIWAILQIGNLREETVRADCVQDNVLIAKIRVGLSGSLRALVPPGQELTADQLAALAAYDAAVIALMDYRDCSSTGLETHRENPPPDPAVTPTGSSLFDLNSTPTVVTTSTLEDASPATDPASPLDPIVTTTLIAEDPPDPGATIVVVVPTLPDITLPTITLPRITLPE
jgi:hypothetical protein